MAKPPIIKPLPMSDRALQRRMAELAADSGRVLLTSHARQRMRQRRVLLTQVLSVLQRGAVVEPAHQNIRGHWQCTLQLSVGGDLVKVAAALWEREPDDAVVVITVMN